LPRPALEGILRFRPGATATMPSDKPNLHPETLAAQGMGRVAEPYRDIVPPIYVSTTYERGADGAFPGGRTYSRADNPTYDQAEQLIATLEGATAAMLFASGEAAAAAVFQGLGPGAGVLAPRNMYWALRKWLLDFAAPWGLAVEFYENASIDDLAAKARARRPRLIWIETPANPTWDITDIAAASGIAGEVGAMVAVDSTVATPLLTQPIALGAHIVMHSATKYLNGHSDVVAGALATAKGDEFWQRLRYIRGSGGAVLGPLEAWLLLRGMRTLHLRVDAASRNAHAIALRLHGHPKLSHVLYPGLPSHPGHAIAVKQMTGGFGGMMSFRLKSGEDAAKTFTAKLRVFKRATSLGSVESLAEHRASVEGPGTQCPADLVRLSIGVEHLDDLIEDIEQALS
jgi:cystathionine gamma-synthase